MVLCAAKRRLSLSASQNDISPSRSLLLLFFIFFNFFFFVEENVIGSGKQQRKKAIDVKRNYISRKESN
jgi:hypothetical protein